MTFTLALDCDNAAFEEDDGRCEVSRILRQVAATLEGGGTEGRCLDLNGNTVGR